MLPTIDSTTPAVGGTTPQIKRPEVEKALEAYQSQSVSDTVSFEEAGGATRATERPTRVYGPRSDTDRFKKSAAQDQAEIKLQLTREEREVFLNAISGRESPSEMSEEEQELLQKTSERIEKLIEEANARDTQTKERVDKAVKEWYTRLSNGKQPPGDLLTLIRQAAAGVLD